VGKKCKKNKFQVAGCELQGARCKQRNKIQGKVQDKKTGCKLQVTSCELRNEIQGKVQNAKTVGQSQFSLPVTRDCRVATLLAMTIFHPHLNPPPSRGKTVSSI